MSSVLKTNDALYYQIGPPCQPVNGLFQVACIILFSFVL